MYMLTKNNLLTPKWKDRTYKTHLKHLEQYANKHFEVAFLGDSMMERWLKTGSKIWNQHYNNYANLGVGGDGIEHLLYRLTDILDVITVDKIVFMIGTNNLERNTIDHIFEGIINIINIIFQKQPNWQLFVYGLLDRTDISPTKIAELNCQLEEYIKTQNNSKLVYRFFGDKVNHDDSFFDDNVHLSFLGYKQWYFDLKDILAG